MLTINQLGSILGIDSYHQVDVNDLAAVVEIIVVGSILMIPALKHLPIIHH